jgi:hypothetical protein
VIDRSLVRLTFKRDLAMTQLLLFDSPASTTETSLVATQSTSTQPQAAESVAAQLEYDGGVHHMGDLARLVLLRYELVAKRRAMMAANREAAKKTR